MVCAIFFTVPCTTCTPLGLGSHQTPAMVDLRTSGQVALTVGGLCRGGLYVPCACSLPPDTACMPLHFSLSLPLTPSHPHPTTTEPALPLPFHCLQFPCLPHIACPKDSSFAGHAFHSCGLPHLHAACLPPPSPWWTDKLLTLTQLDYIPLHSMHFMPY